MLINKLFNLILLITLAIIFVFLILIVLGFGSLFLSQLLILFLIEISCLIRNIAELMHLKELFHPFSTLIQHSLLDAWLLSLLYLQNQALSL